MNIVPVLLDAITVAASIDYSRVPSLRTFRQDVSCVFWDVWASAFTVNGKVSLPEDFNVEEYIKKNNAEGMNCNRSLAVRKLQNVSELSPEIMISYGDYLKKENPAVEVVEAFLFRGMGLSNLPEKEKLKSECKNFLVIPVVIGNSEGSVFQKMAKSMGYSGAHVVSFLVDFTDGTIEFYDPKGCTCEDRKGQSLRSSEGLDLPGFLIHLNKTYGNGSFTIVQNTTKNQWDLHNGGVYLCNYYQRRLIERKDPVSIFTSGLTTAEANSYRSQICRSICSVQEAVDTMLSDWYTDFSDVQDIARNEDQFVASTMRQIRQVAGTLFWDIWVTAASRNRKVSSPAGDIEAYIKENKLERKDYNQALAIRKLQRIVELSPEVLQCYGEYLKKRNPNVEMIESFLFRGMNFSNLPEKVKLDEENKTFLVIPVVIENSEDTLFQKIVRIMGFSGAHVVTFLVDFVEKTIEFYDPKGLTCVARKGQCLRSCKDLDLPGFLDHLQEKYGNRSFKIVQNTKRNQGDLYNCGVYLCNYYYRRLVERENSTSIFANPLSVDDANQYRAEISSQLCTGGVEEIGDGWLDLYSRKTTS